MFSMCKPLSVEIPIFATIGHFALVSILSPLEIKRFFFEKFYNTWIKHSKQIINILLYFAPDLAVEIIIQPLEHKT